MIHISRSEEETLAYGAELASRLKGGEIIFLCGDFGCGKTVFVKGMASALRILPHTVTSPSFTLLQSYSGSLNLHHVDLYRIESSEAIDELVLEEFVAPDSILVVEWAQHWTTPTLNPTYRLEFSHDGDDRRRISITPE